LKLCEFASMGKGGKRGGGGGGYPWWEHIKGKGGKKGKHEDEEQRPVQKIQSRSGPESELEKYVKSLEGRSYPAYKDLVGEWECGHVTIFVDRVQGDPYAAPSSLRVRVSMKDAGFPADHLEPSIRNSALCDFITRAFSDLIIGGSGTDWTQSVNGGGGWSGSKGGNMEIDAPGQFVLPRTSVVATSTYVEVRVLVSLPAHGRTIEGFRAAEIIGRGLIPAVEQSLFFSAVDQGLLWKHIQSVEDQEFCRSKLTSLDLVGFVANGSILPRKSGVDGRPMTSVDDPNLVSFTSPESLQVSMTLPHAGRIEGMGIKKGITLIIGGGFHGKSTLLQSLQVGMYNKVPGDGREFVVFDPCGVKVRAEDGRFIAGTDISAFINNLPFEKDTTNFSTKDASGSTSQAANIIDALEIGATSLLVDEDTCATNFMIRDARMQALVAPDNEPITAFIQKVRPLFQQEGVSTVMVIGGTGDFFEVATTVIQMDRYSPKDVTAEAQQVVRDMPSSTGIATKDKLFGSVTPRKLLSQGLAADGKVSAKTLRCISYGDTEVELTNVEQLVEISQAKAIADCLQMLGDPNGVSASRTLREVVEALAEALVCSDKGVNGLDTLSRFNHPNGFYALPRKFEIAGAISRLRTLQVASRK